MTKDTVTAVEHSSAEQYLLSQAEFPEGKPRIRLADFDPSSPFVGPTPESAESKLIRTWFCHDPDTPAAYR